MTYSIIPKSHLEGALRLDAEYYQSGFLDIANIINRLPYKKEKLGNFSDLITNGHTPLHADLAIGDVYFLTAEDIFDHYINYDTAKRILKKDSDGELKNTILKEGDLLITIKGKVGNASVVYNLKQETNINQDVSRVILKKNINPFYVATFINSRYGKLQVNRISTSQINPFLGIGNLKEIIIPIVKENIQEKISQVVKEGLTRLEKSKFLYVQAEDLLLEELGIKDLKLEEDLTFATTLKNCLQAGRIDADFFQPKYERILSKMKVKKEKLSNLVAWHKGIEPGSEEYTEEGKPFIRVSNMSKFGLNDNNQQYLSEKMYNELKDKYQPQKGDILLSKDATPGIAVLLEKDVEGIISGGTLRLKIKDKTLVPQYLSLVLNSVICQMQIERDAGGSIIIHWRPDQVENTIIPILPLKTQQKIADLVNESFKLRKEAKLLLEEAKKRVEEEIEKK